MSFKKPVLHLIYIVPPGGLITRLINKLALRSRLFPPLYRYARDIFVGWPKPVYAPFSITYNLIKALNNNFTLKLYDWNEQGTIKLRQGEYLLFHPAPDYQGPLDDNQMPLNIDTSLIGYRASTECKDCKLIIIMPYTHDDDNGWLMPLFCKRKLDMVAICGEYWTKDWSRSAYHTYVNKFLQLNMCIDTKEYPTLKKNFNPKGKRKFLYIGHTAAYKNTSQLEAIAAEYPNFQGGHIGYGRIKGWDKIAEKLEFSFSNLKKLAAEYDIFINCSRADAQATTVLEQMCLGFAVACTPQSGYAYPGIYSLDINDTTLNCEQLDIIQHADEKELLDRARQNRLVVEERHSWGGFSKKLLEFIEN